MKTWRRLFALVSLVGLSRSAIADPLTPVCVDKWCWDAPRPQGRDLRSVFPFAPDDVWAAGNGMLVHYDGTRWQGFVSADRSLFFGLWGSRRDDLWAVGTSIIHWDGHTWTPVARLASTGFYGVWGSATDDVWAVGQNGTVLHWDGHKWTRSTTRGPNVTWRAVSGSGRNDVWIVGDHGQALHWDGRAWQSVTIEDDSAGEPPRLYGVFSRAPADVWIVGLPEAAFHYDGHGWRRVRGVRCPKGGDLDNQPGEYLTAVWGDRERIWAVGAGPDNRIVRLLPDGSWVEELSAHFPLAAVRDGWAVGNRGTILRRSESGWSEVTESVVGGITALLAGEHVPIVGVGQAQKLFLRNEQGWGFARVDTPTLLAIDGVFDDNWSVGQDGATLHYDGKQWIAGKTPSAEMLTAVARRARDDVWAVGFGGAVVHWNGRKWAAVTLPTKAALSGVWASSARDVWIVGEGGTLWRGNGRKWTSVDVGAATPWLTRVRGRAADDVWAVGWGGVVVHWNGKQWTRLPPIPGHESAKLGQLRLGREVVVSGEDFVARWNGERWQIVGEHVSELHDFVLTREGDVWIVAAEGIFVRDVD